MRFFFRPAILCYQVHHDLPGHPALSIQDGSNRFGKLQGVFSVVEKAFHPFRQQVFFQSSTPFQVKKDAQVGAWVFLKQRPAMLHAGVHVIARAVVKKEVLLTPLGPMRSEFGIAVQRNTVCRGLFSQEGRNQLVLESIWACNEYGMGFHGFMSLTPP
jgi:hypothetical protein